MQLRRPCERLVVSVLTHKIRFGWRSDDSKCQMFSVGATPNHPLVSFGSSPSSHDNIILFVTCILSWQCLFLPLVRASVWKSWKGDFTTQRIAWWDKFLQANRNNSDEKHSLRQTMLLFKSISWVIVPRVPRTGKSVNGQWKTPLDNLRCRVCCKVVKFKTQYSC